MHLFYCLADSNISSCLKLDLVEPIKRATVVKSHVLVVDQVVLVQLIHANLEKQVSVKQITEIAFVITKLKTR